MRKKRTSIPVNQFGGEADSGINIEKIAFKDLPRLEEWSQPERHDRHSFFLLEKGMVKIEIDFQNFTIKSPALIYMHPSQVHRILAFQSLTVNSLGINNENLYPHYLKLLEELTPANPRALDKESFSLLSEAASLCVKLSKRKQDKLSHFLLRDSCNALVGLMLSQYIEATRQAGKRSRPEIVTKAFNALLERNYTSLKRPAAYARELHISTPYLNECIKHITGHPVSYHIQQRIILEAKRLLHHSPGSVKEIAAALGYDDYAYFSRLFTKVTGMTALTFREKNLD